MHPPGMAAYIGIAWKATAETASKIQRYRPQWPGKPWPFPGVLQRNVLATH
jgi:hypothetical protein